MSSSLRYPRSGTALHGLVILALAAILVDCLFSGQEAVKIATFEPQKSAASCVYQVMLDDYCLGTAFLCQPESLSKILETLGLDDEFGAIGSSERIPCDRMIKFRGGSPVYSLGKIAGAHLACAGRPIDINLADEVDLLAVPGIGPRIAERIVRHREKLGGFSKIEDLTKVPGIGRKKFMNIAPFVEVKPSRSFNKLQYVQAP